VKRDRLRAARLATAKARLASKRTGEKVLEASAAVNVHRDASGHYYVCAKCETPLGTLAENFKVHALLETLPASAASPLIGDPFRYIDAPVTMRRFCCPGCGRLLEVEIVAGEAPLLHDMKLELG
jgi:acetone carboxylase gamma subunit